MKTKWIAAALCAAVAGVLWWGSNDSPLEGADLINGFKRLFFSLLKTLKAFMFF